MVIISKNESAGFRRYGSSQFRYAMTYVFITFVVLLLLNIYCTRTSHQLFYQNKQVSMIEKCHLAADEISQLEVLNQENIADALSRLGSMTSTRMLITDRTGLVLYDSQGSALQTYAIFPEVARALNSQGHRYGYDAFSWHYHDGDMRSSAATPIISYDTIAGCVYITEHDPKQGAQAGKLLSLTGKAGESVFQIGNSNLQNSFSRFCSLSKNVQNQHSSVNDAHVFQNRFQISDLIGSQLAVKNHQIAPQ